MKITLDTPNGYALTWGEHNDYWAWGGQLAFIRLPANSAERECMLMLAKRKWFVSKRGWPDFFCMRWDGRVMFVEVKKDKYEPLRHHQQIVMSKLIAMGFDCFIYSPDVGLTRLKRDGKWCSKVGVS